MKGAHTIPHFRCGGPIIRQKKAPFRLTGRTKGGISSYDRALAHGTVTLAKAQRNERDPPCRLLAVPKEVTVATLSTEQQAMVALFQRHVEAELAGDLETTMATMTDDPHLNHVPTMAGGVGRDGVRAFYR